ncbi:methylated-DNA--[protein]-cysteine S-methyltransferase [Ruficoccus amylovorans]|uniref:methylated-DNA--[protein]-cysteine S-methyltransferase n=1 Tax=Ruficoccus amylovorans TaxID=1804625 RepID=A0A842HGG7_9BACT|nr:methylated-DNA--[protein]-cysteine S-methyltransferase [Ruficoccus amylovorans]MBC2595512.1 methylated-DNA--[protein]-cysteine S-methyltransferase [Ruficoccus amylovorans]
MSLASPTVNYGSTDSPYGPCLLAVSEDRLVYLGFLLPGEQAVPVLTAAGLGPALTRDDKSTRCWAGRVFSGEAVPIAPRGTSFQLAVWDALKAIPRGQTRTYSEIAHAVDRPLATRAVGTAIGRNPLAWLIPCHRVIRRDGALGGFRWGLPLKRRLLREEGVPCPQ